MVNSNFRKIFVYTVIGVVAVSVVLGFFVVGSPQEERLRQFDDRRVSDLQFLQSEIINYWQSKNKLPGDLNALRDDIRGVYPPKDPQTGSAYTYTVQGPLTFSLCAVFALPSLNAVNPKASVPVPMPMPVPAGPAPYYTDQNWSHDVGNVCFERTIDPQLYKLKTPQ